MTTTMTFSTSAQSAVSEEEIRQSIQEILMARHPTDTPEWWRALGPQAPGIIISMYEQTTHIAHRAKLLQGLSAFDTPEAVNFLKKEADGAHDDVIRNTAIKGVGTAAGAREEEYLAKYLHAEDPQTRLVAAQALARIGDARSKQLLDQFRSEETTPWVLSRLNGTAMPQGAGALKPVSTSEDRLSPEFAGEWRGYWLSPKELKQPGMIEEDALVRIEVEGATSLKADVVFTSKAGKSRTGNFEGVRGKGTEITATVVLKTPKRLEIPVEGSLTQEAENYLLALHSKKFGGWLILRRSPKAE